MAQAAVQSGCRSVAFTYNDPVIFLEYAVDVAQACRERGEWLEGIEQMEERTTRFRWPGPGARLSVGARSFCRRARIQSCGP